MGNKTCCTANVSLQTEMNLTHNSNDNSSFTSSLPSSSRVKKLNLHSHNLTPIKEKDKIFGSNQKSNSTKVKATPTALSRTRVSLQDLRNSDFKILDVIQKKNEASEIMLKVPNKMKNIVKKNKAFLTKILENLRTPTKISLYEIQLGVKDEKSSSTLNFLAKVYSHNFGENFKSSNKSKFYLRMISQERNIFFEGEVINFNPKQGVLIHESQDGIETIKGSFRNFFLEGFGEIESESGDYFKGNIIKGMKEGFCQVIWKDGDAYKGNFTKNEKNGEGVYKYINGDVYSGNWEFGKKQGKGKFFFPKNFPKFLNFFRNLYLERWEDVQW